MRPPLAGAASYRLEQMSVGDEIDLHPVIQAGRVAVITGAASSIGRAAAEELARLGLKVALSDIAKEALEKLGKKLVGIIGEGNVLVIPTDVSKLEEVVRLRDKVYEAWGEVAVLFNNASVGAKGTSWEGIESWRRVFDVNLFGVVNVQQTFVPSMLHQENQAVIINSGSKRGITNVPGYGAYNASEAAIKSLTESLAHELRVRPQTNVTAHLFMPGWTLTDPHDEESLGPPPRGAWTATESVAFMLDAVRQGVFYIMVPDGKTRMAVDKLRIMWAAADITEGRPALSRWHPNYKALFEEYMREGLAQLDE